MKTIAAILLMVFATLAHGGPITKEEEVKAFKANKCDQIRLGSKEGNEKFDACLQKSWSPESYRKWQLLNSNIAPTIGMTKEEVLKTTSWSGVLKRYTTVTANGEAEQWVVYGKGNLYFTNGRLTAIQTQE